MKCNFKKISTINFSLHLIISLQFDYYDIWYRSLLMSMPHISYYSHQLRQNHYPIQISNRLHLQFSCNPKNSPLGLIISKQPQPFLHLLHFPTVYNLSQAKRFGDCELKVTVKRSAFTIIRISYKVGNGGCDTSLL